MLELGFLDKLNGCELFEEVANERQEAYVEYFAFGVFGIFVLEISQDGVVFDCDCSDFFATTHCTLQLTDVNFPLIHYIIKPYLYSYNHLPY